MSSPRLNLYDAYSQCFPSLEKTLLTTADGTSYSYEDAERRSAQIANYLISSGFEVGDRVSVQVEKTPESLWLFLGVVRAGLIFHPLNTAYTDTELAFFLADAGTGLLVCDPSRERSLGELCDRLGGIALRTLGADSMGTLVDGYQMCAETFETAATLGQDVASLVYSSGTTGQPKGIMLSHANLIANATTLVSLWGFSEEDCLLHALPTFHVHGLFVALGCVLMSGASMRWLPRFDVNSVLQQMPESSVMMGVPTFYSRLLAEPAFSASSCASMRLFISGSAPLLPEAFDAFSQRTGFEILERYGMTETGMNTSNPLDGVRKPGTVGLPLPDVEVRICGSDGLEVEEGEIGELQVKGPNVFVGYWGLPEKTAQDFTPDGYFVTGDQASCDSDGYISIVGRSKDLVITGGLNVYPKEVELLIDSMAEVEESAVIGLADADFGEAVVAVVVLRAGASLNEAAVRSFVDDRAASYKVPKRVFFAEQLPRNAMSKVQKAVLREQFARAVDQETGDRVSR